MKKFITLLLFIFLGFETSHACICGFGLFEDRVKESSFIFIGKVISVEDVYEEGFLTEQIIKLEIEKRFKGNQNDTLVVTGGFSSCSFLFEENKKYLVFADHLIGGKTSINQSFIENNDNIITDKCYGTKKLGEPYSEEMVGMLEKLFSSNLSIKDISAEKLYSEIWKNESFIFTDETAEFPFGSDSLSSFVQKNLRSCSLPDERPNSSLNDDVKDDSLYKALNMDFEPRDPTFVWVHFDVSKTGELNNFRVDRDFSLNKECNDEALRVAKLMPDWIPAKIKGIPVNTIHSIEIDFKSKTAY